MLRINRFIRHVQVKYNRFKCKYSIVLRNKFPHIRIQNRHEKTIKYIIRILTFISIVSAIITFKYWYIALLFSVVMFILEQVFEGIIFIENAMIVQPLPKSWKSDCWASMVSFLDKANNLSIGFGFTDKVVAFDFWETLLAWNDGKLNNQNIEIVFVLEGEKEYSVFLSPSSERNFVKKSYEIFQRRFDKKKNADKELDVFVVQMCFCKVFPFSETCAYSILKRHTGEVSLCIIDHDKISSPSDDGFYLDDRKILCQNINAIPRKELSPQENVVAYYWIP